MERASSSGLKLRHGGCLGHMTSVHSQTGQPGAGRSKASPVGKKKEKPKLRRRRDSNAGRQNFRMRSYLNKGQGTEKKLVASL
jgi:hypothetical protein